MMYFSKCYGGWVESVYVIRLLMCLGHWASLSFIIVVGVPKVKYLDVVFSCGKGMGIQCSYRERPVLLV